MVGNAVAHTVGNPVQYSVGDAVEYSNQFPDSIAHYAISHTDDHAYVVPDHHAVDIALDVAFQYSLRHAVGHCYH